MLEDKTRLKASIVGDNPQNLSERVQNQTNHPYLIKGLNTLGRTVVGAGSGASVITASWGAGYFGLGLVMGISDETVQHFLKSVPYTATIGALIGTGIAIYYTIFPEN